MMQYCQAEIMQVNMQQSANHLRVLLKDKDPTEYPSKEPAGQYHQKEHDA